MHSLVGEDGALQDRLRAMDADDAIIDLHSLDQRSQIGFAEGDFSSRYVLAHERAEPGDLVCIQSNRRSVALDPVEG
ncbi:hypothetical protein [Methylocapsa acidiphila]|uniref:hypothetical protein n=1 Tax=Methylocapsa acidiphila TaxID=133552 RepID=UPI00047CAB5D|nr:hypothetical protein [Methylocapsa acidiphila]